LSRHKDEEAAGFSNSSAAPAEPGRTSVQTKPQNFTKSTAVLLAIVLVLIAVLGTQLRQSIAKTVERVGRSITLEGQLAAEWLKSKTNNQ
jgi:hypothetical protein